MLETVATIARWYFGQAGDYGPHIYMIYGWDDAWHAVINQDRLHEMGVDTFLVWDNCYLNRDKPTPDFRYELSNPNLKPMLAQLKTRGGRVLQYVGPSRWLAAGGTLYQLLGELDRHGWADGVAMDGTWIRSWDCGLRDGASCTGAAHSLCEIEDFLCILTERMRGPNFLHHSVPDPFSGPENQGGLLFRFQPRPITKYFDWVMWGETNPGWPTSLDDPMWRYMISGAYRGYIGIYKPMEKVQNPWDVKTPDNRDWIAMAPNHLITYRCTRQRIDPQYPHWPNWTKHFYEPWKVARDAYLANQEGWIKAFSMATGPAGPENPPSPT